MATAHSERSLCRRITNIAHAKFDRNTTSRTQENVAQLEQTCRDRCRKRRRGPHRRTVEQHLIRTSYQRLYSSPLITGRACCRRNYARLILYATRVTRLFATRYASDYRAKGILTACITVTHRNCPARPCIQAHAYIITEQWIKILKSEKIEIPLLLCLCALACVYIPRALVHSQKDIVEL